ncbi:protein FAM200B-like [Melanaphis sacchari]|uniref:protein FAM200B-like n=1 Tax=Melanaphis sacchari TaxID=742174 RepID=UPI000DC13E76|nr:protein FAM200B-like [Melanaphis sacchari]
MDKFIIRKTTADDTNQNTNVQPVQSVSSAKPKVKLTPSGNRSYNTDFIQFGFRSCESNEIVQPQCVVCGEILANESLKPFKLKRHLKTKHPNVNKKPKEYFERLNDQFVNNTNAIKTYCHTTFSGVKASYLLAYRIAKNNKPHTIGENLILPAAIDMCTEILGKEAANKLKIIPASNNTVQRRILDINENLKQQLLNRLNAKPILFLFYSVG